MKKIFGSILIILFLNSCAETVAIFGPASTTITGGNAAQSTLTSAFSYKIKKETGKSPMEHAFKYVEKHNPENKKSKCVSFLESTNSEICEALKKNILETKKKIAENSKIKFLDKKN